MAKRKGKKRSVAHLKKYQFKSKSKSRKSRKRSTGMAKKRKSSKGARRTRSRSSGRRRTGGSGGGRGFSALKSDSHDLLLGGLYGVVEAKAKADDSFILNKVPRPIVALGYTGNIALMLYAATLLTGNAYVRKGARVVATIAAYKLGKNGGSFKDSGSASIGEDDDMGDENIIDANTMGALDAEGVEVLSARGSSSYDTRQGVPYDDVVEQAGSRA